MADIVICAGNRNTLAHLFSLAITAGQFLFVSRLGVGQQHLVLRAARAGQAGHDGAEIEFQRVGEDGIGRIGFAPQALRLRISLDQRHGVGIAAGQHQIIDGLGIDREEAAGGAIFRRHVGQRGAIGQRERIKAGAIIFDEAANDALPAQHLGGGEHQIGGGHAFGQVAGELEADDFGDEHGNRLAQHRGFGFDAADAPAQHAEAVDHRGVAVRAHARIRIGDHGARSVFAAPDRLGEIFQVHLVADAGAGRHRAEILQRAAAPAQELIAFQVAGIFQRHIVFKRLGVAEFIDHHAVIDHQIDRHQRVDLHRIAAELGDGIAHGGQIDDARHAGEILHQHAGRAIVDLVVRRAGGLPIDHGLHVGGGHRAAIFKTQQILQQHLHRIGQARDVAQLRRGGLQAVIGIFLARGLQRAAGVQTVLADGGHCASPFVCALTRCRTI